MPRLIGEELMTRHAVAFELAGLLLTVAVIGAVALAMRDDGSESDLDRSRPLVLTEPEPTRAPDQSAAELAIARTGR